MSLSLNRTIDHLKNLMAGMKDLVFPLYSDVKEEDALSEVYNSLRSATDYTVADAFLPKIPEIKRLLELDVQKIYTGHCTGNRAFEILHEVLGERACQMFTGMSIEV